MDAGTRVRGHVRVWGEFCCSAPQYGRGVNGGETRDTHRNTHRNTHTHTEEPTRKCCTYPLATYPLKSFFWQCRQGIQERKGHINLRKSPSHRTGVPGTPSGTNRGLPAGVSQGFPVINKRKTDRKGHFCRDASRVPRGHPAIQGFSNILCDFFLCAFFFAP